MKNSKSKEEHQQLLPSKKIFLPLATPVVPLLVFAVLAITSITEKSATYDEAVLLTSGAHFVRTFDNSLNAENPPLLKALFAFPTLFFPEIKHQNFPDSLRYTYDQGEEVRYSNEFLFSKKNHQLILLVCRSMAVLTASLMGFSIYLVSSKIWNRLTASVLLWIYILSPNIVAHARLFTFDLGCAFLMFLTIVSVHLMMKNGGAQSIIFSGVMLGLSLLAKFTAVILLPSIFFQSLTYLTVYRKWDDWNKVLLRFGGCICIALLLVNFFYAFSGFGESLTDLNPKSPLLKKLGQLPFLAMFPLPIPLAYLRGFDIAAFWNKPGLWNFFLGEFYPQGGSWWYYYFVVLALKVPLPVWIGVTWSLLILIYDKKRNLAPFLTFAVLPIVVFLNHSFISYRQLGLRNILPIWPFMILHLGFLIEKVRMKGIQGGARVGVGCLAVWYIISSLLCYPNYLTYCNEAAGGSYNGWRYLADSNFDWGQDLPALSEWQKQNGNPPMYVIYYGTAPLEAYGVMALEWGVTTLPVYLAVSASSHYYLFDKNSWVASIIREQNPIERLGNTIFIYSVDKHRLAR